MKWAHYSNGDGVETTCPDCDSPATYDDNGINCSNPDCENSR